MKLMFFFCMIICASSGNFLKGNDISLKQKKVVIDSTVYSNKLYKLVVFRERGKLNRFKIYNVKNLAQLTGRPELITVEGEVPEGTNRFDYNNPNDQMGYPCDSSYRYFSDRFKVTFAIEKGTKKRLDLTISDSKNKDFKNGDHTLTRK